MHPLRHRRDSQSGFTLIELLVVMLIIGILAAIAIPAFFKEDTKVVSAEVCHVSNSSVQLPEEAGGSGTFELEEGQEMPVLHSSYRFTVNTSEHTITSVEPLRAQDDPLRC